MNETKTHDPSLTSWYVGEDFYQDLVDAFTDWQTDEREVDDLALRDTCRRLLEKEARLLDRRRLEDWIALYAPECVYWVPATPHGGDPRREIAVSFDDRRRLEDRIFRLRNDFAWSQRPQSRTARLVSNVTVFATGDQAELMVCSTFLTTELQAGDRRTYAGWYGHRLRRLDDGWRIVVKQVNLIDCDQNLRNPSIVL
ncbi:MAG: aromatic-ring-hydroxylating dioxygenase [Alphaproteobacteria bacterium]|nr:aromatic-ring-hydroxylating dioxygenase [Alphaproteobacteria bacterium]